MGMRTIRLAVGLAILVGLAGCGSPCRGACNLVNDLECSDCDCSACNDAPASCDEYFQCINDQDSCLEIGLGCSPSAECAVFVDDHCG